MASAMPRQLSVSAAWANAYRVCRWRRWSGASESGLYASNRRWNAPSSTAVAANRRAGVASGPSRWASVSPAGTGVDLGGGQVLAEQSRRLYAVGGAVVVDADDDADAMAVRHRAAEHCEVSHAVHSSVVSVFSPMRSPVMPSCLVVRGAGAGCHVASGVGRRLWRCVLACFLRYALAVSPICGDIPYMVYLRVCGKLNWNP